MTEKLVIPPGPSVGQSQPLVMVGPDTRARPNKHERSAVIRHGDLLGQVAFTIRHIRDLNNVLGFLKAD